MFLKCISLTISIFAFTISCTDDSLNIPDNTLVVVQAYLYENEPVTEIRLTETIVIDADTTSAPPINNAQVILVKNDSSYSLFSSAGDSGYYHYPGIDLNVNSGDKFDLKIYYDDQYIFAQTVVPASPVNISISDENLEVIEFIPGNPGLMDENTLEVTWLNENDELFYLVIDNIEVNPLEIETGFSRMPRKWISQPMNRDFFSINQRAVTHYGLHRIKLFRLNQEYADLYQSRTQDSRDLNEPLTNIENGLGIFSAFASDSVFFTVK